MCYTIITWVRNISEMFKKIINILLAENIDFQISQEGDHYVMRSPILKGKISAWFIIDNPLTGAPCFYSYKNNYRLDFVFSRYQDYITVVSDIVISLQVKL